MCIGHSERREGHGETDEVVAAKVKAAYAHDLTPILCCGEALDVRKEGRQVEHVVAQLRAALDGVSKEQVASIVIAYEPIWAIGTGEVATPEDAQEVCAAIRTLLAELYSGDVADGIRVLYGGSVKSGNVAAIMSQEDVDGALVGGASIDPAEFASICRYRDHLADELSLAPPEPPRCAGGPTPTAQRSVDRAGGRYPCPSPGSDAVRLTTSRRFGVTTWMRFASPCRSCWCCPAWS